MGDTSIQWTDKSWNPIRARNLETGGVGHFCEKVSPGCANCYAARMQPRFRNKIRYNAADRDKVELFLDEDVLLAPLKWRKPSFVFPCSMTDLFGEWVSDEWLDRIFAVMALAPWHRFQVVTKRAERMRDYMQTNSTGGHILHVASTIGSPQSGVWPLLNVWLGVSAEDQKTLQERWGYLRRTPAAVRFISMEPLLAPIDMQSELWEDLGEFIWPDWIIVGGESGTNARPCDIHNIRSIVEQCKSAGVACFVKQLGAKPILDCPVGEEDAGQFRDDGSARYWTLGFIKDRKGGDINEWPEDLRVREFPTTLAVAAA